MSGFGTPISRVGLAVLKRLPGMEKVAISEMDLWVKTLDVPKEPGVPGSNTPAYKHRLTYSKYKPRAGTVVTPDNASKGVLKRIAAKASGYGKSAVGVANALGSGLLTVFMLKSFIDQANVQKQQDRLYEEQLRAYEEYRQQQQAKTAELKSEEPPEKKPVEFSKEAKLDLLEVGTPENAPGGSGEQENAVETLLNNRYGGAV